MERFTPYEGKKPFVFISYARKDGEMMMAVMKSLRTREYRLWYDEGIPGGNDWPLYISQHLQASSAVVFFLSARSMVSPNCYSEMKSAQQKKIPVICVPLDDCADTVKNAVIEKRPLTSQETQLLEDETRELALRRRSNAKIPLAGDWSEALREAVFADGNRNAVDIEKEILACGVLHDGFKGSYETGIKERGDWNGWLLAVILCMLVLAGVTIGGLRLIKNDRQEPVAVTTPEPETPTPKPTVDPGSIPGISAALVFPDSQQERAIRSVTGIKEGEVEDTELRKVTQLHFCGKTVVTSPERIRYENGEWYIGTARAEQGQIRDLSLLQKAYYLEKLTLADQKVTSVLELKGLQVLSELNISGNPISELSLSGGFQALESLNISHTAIRTLRSIDAPTTLKTIYISLDMLPMEFDETAAYEVVLVK